MEEELISKADKIKVQDGKLEEEKEERKKFEWKIKELEGHLESKKYRQDPLVLHGTFTPNVLTDYGDQIKYDLTSKRSSKYDNVVTSYSEFNYPKRNNPTSNNNVKLISSSRESS